MEEQMPTSVNFNRLKKPEMVWLYNNRCQKHRRRYTEHPGCFKEDYEGIVLFNEKIGFVDIESSRLEADFGFIFCWSIKELDGDLIHRSVTPKEIKVTYVFDYNVVKDFIAAIEPFDRLVGYYSKDYRFDIPYLRTRALRWELDFPEWREHLFTDVYDLAKAKLRLHRTRMENVADLLGIPSKQHRLNPEVWQKAQAGHKESLDYIQVHCDEDVITLEAIYKKLFMYGRPNRNSI